MGLNNDYSPNVTFRTLFASLVVLFLTVTSTSAQLSSTYYSSTCPTALSIIKSVVASAVAEEARMGASLLRLHYHDCFVNGCDGSVLLDDTSTFTGEKHSIPNNNSLRGFDVIDNIKSKLESSCPGIVSCADIVAVAARDSTVLLGGPRWKVLLGRRDATTTSLNATSALPGSKLNLTDLISAFSAKGLTAKEMVALSGSHTIGQTRCTVFKSRIYNETNIDSSFSTTRKENCPLSGGDDNLAPLDLSTPTKFDNTYFKDLLTKKGLLHSDQQFYNDGSTDSYVFAYASNPGSFRTDFAKAMVKLGNLNPLTGTSGQVRTNCRKIN